MDPDHFASRTPIRRKRNETVRTNIDSIHGFMKITLVLSIFLLNCGVIGNNIPLPSYTFDMESGPQDENTTPRFNKSRYFPNVTAYLGEELVLSCDVIGPGDYTVSWIRKRDLSILAIGLTRYNTDPRFTPLHTSPGPGNSGVWGFRISEVRQNDAGLYECQLSSAPKKWQSYRVTVLEPRARILGDSKDVYVTPGSRINITCQAVLTKGKSVFIIWEYNGDVIDYTTRGGINVEVNVKERTSTLRISNASKSDEGNYTCSPDTAFSASVYVHVQDLQPLPLTTLEKRTALRERERERERERDADSAPAYMTNTCSSSFQLIALNSLLLFLACNSVLVAQLR